MGSETTAIEQLNSALAGRYAIERLVGEGGMATVYLARDLRHDRRVALKVLKPELGAVLGVERFLSEIKVTANLQHPNLLPLFDSGEANGLLFYVMPYVQGESLRARIDREKQLPIDEAVRIAVAVGGALDYAHRNGVVHRDLKPENILLQDGQPVIADFGIALAVSNAGGTRVTQTGLSLGTPQYMSPEQASGDRAVDARSDIYSLAAVLFEMIAGEPPHTGPTVQAVIAKLMASEPLPLGELRKTTPIHVDAAVTRALAKLPADRFSSARDFVDALEGRGLTAAMMAVTGMRAGPARRPLLREPLVMGLGAALLVAVGVAVEQWNAAHREVPRDVVRLHIDLPTSMLVGNVAVSNLAVSPDGKTIAYVSVGDNAVARIYVRALDAALPQPIPGTEGALQPTFSPDGRSIAYILRDQVWKVSLEGGSPISLGTTGASPAGISWSPNGDIYVGVIGSLLAVSSTGGGVRVVAPLDSAKGEIFANNPLALDDGDGVLLTIQTGGGITNNKLAFFSKRTGTLTRFDNLINDPMAMIGDQLIYAAANGSLNAIGFDASKGVLTSDPVALGISTIIRNSASADATVSPTGTLVYQPASSESQLGWVTQGGEFMPVLSDPQAYSYPRLSPDGGRVALSIGSGAGTDIWSYDLASRTNTRLTNNGSRNDRPEWSPDGKRVLYRGDRGTRSEIWWQPVDNSAPAEVLQGSVEHDFYEGILTPDGRTLLYQIDDGGATQADVLYRSLEGDTTSKAVVASPFVDAWPRVSPDGRWVAFVTDQSGGSQVVVQPFPAGGAQVVVSVAGGSEPVWSRDGSRIFYRDGRSLIEARVSTSSGFSVTGRQELFRDEYEPGQAPHANYDVSLDGKRFLMVKPVRKPEIEIVYGWLSELNARLKQ